jgi:putative ABC transport system permease protein
MLQDLRYGLRMALKDRSFTAIAVFTLALGIGANTAIFSVVKAVLLSSLPYPEPERLVAVAESDPDTPGPETVDFTTTSDWRERSQSFEHLALYRNFAMTLVDGGEPELLQGMRVGWNFFDTLGVKMELGRSFVPEEDQPEQRYVLVLSHGLWLRRFGADPDVIGKRVRLNEATFSVVGVLPRNYRPLLASLDDPIPEMYAPLGYALSQSFACRGCQHLRLIGRLRPGVSVVQAETELGSIMRSLVREYPTSYDSQAGARVELLQERLVGKVSTAIWVLFAAVGFVLLIACANVANLLLVRATDREREMALRAALGAGRGRLVRLVLVESLLIALAGGAAGVLVGAWGTSLLTTIAPKEIPRLDEISMDLPVLGFSLAVTILTSVLFGLAPALRCARVHLIEALRDSARSTGGASRYRLRGLLVTGELALAFLLVVGAGLLGKSFLRLTSVDPGFDPKNVLTLVSYVWGQRYQRPAAELNLYRQVMERVRAIPGVEGAAMVSTLPFASYDRRGFHIRHRPLANPSQGPSTDHYSVTPDYFPLMRISLKRGRLFTETDREGTPQVALISESCAAQLFPNEDPLGKEVQFGAPKEDQPWATIVGIVGDVQQYALDRPPTMQSYVAQAQDVGYVYTMLVRTTGDPRGIERAVRETVSSVDPTQPVYNVRPLEEYLAASLAERRFTLTLLGLFGAIGLVMAGIGAYGVISYAVRLRTREVGIRMALGAQRRDVLLMVLRQGSALAGVGLAVGYVASLGLTRFLATMLFEVRPTDLAVVALVAVTLAAVSFIASYLPALRATRVDPMVALRHE